MTKSLHFYKTNYTVVIPIQSITKVVINSEKTIIEVHQGQNDYYVRKEEYESDEQWNVILDMVREEFQIA